MDNLQNFNGLSLTQPVLSQQQIFTQFNTRCSKGNEGFLVCIDRNCTKANPFICFSRECQCGQLHKKCDQKRLSAISDCTQQILIQRTEVRSAITKIFDSLHDKVSDACDSILCRVQQGRNHNQQFEQTEGNELDYINQAMQKQNLNGAMIYKVFNSAKRKKSQLEHNLTLQTLKKHQDSFIKKELTRFVMQIQQTVLANQPKTDQLCFLPQMLAEGLILETNTRIRCGISSNCFYPKALISPALHLIHSNQKLLNFRVKIIKSIGNIRFGFFKINKTEKKDFHHKFFTESDMGCKMLEFKDFLKRGRRIQKFQDNSFMSIKLNPKDQKLSFYYQKTDETIKIKVDYDPNNSLAEMEYFIAVDLQQEGDEVEIIPVREKAQSRDIELKNSSCWESDSFQEPGYQQKHTMANVRGRVEHLDQKYRPKKRYI